MRTILVTTADALAATEKSDPSAAVAARDRARQLLERLRDRVEASGDPDLIAMYREAQRLVGYGTMVVAAVAGIVG